MTCPNWEEPLSVARSNKINACEHARAQATIRARGTRVAKRARAPRVRMAQHG